MSEIKVVDGCMENYRYEEHHRGKNWIARVLRDIRSPGGIHREFFARAGMKRWYVLPVDLKAGDLVEVAGDYISTSKHDSRTKDRDYSRVISVTETALVVEDITLRDVLGGEILGMR